MKKRVLLLLLLSIGFMSQDIFCGRSKKIRYKYDGNLYVSEKYPVKKCSTVDDILEAIYIKYFKGEKSKFDKDTFLKRFYTKKGNKGYCKGCSECTKKNKKSVYKIGKSKAGLHNHIMNYVLQIRFLCKFCKESIALGGSLSWHRNTIQDN